MAGCCGFDHGSKAQRLPSLLDITVVEGIFRAALSTMVDRERKVAAGEMSAEAFEEAKAKLVRWLVTAFSGGNPYYRTDSEWHGAAMAAYLAELINDRGHSDRQVLTRACEAFASQAADLAHDIVSRSRRLDEPEVDAVVTNVCGSWAALFTGAPAGDV